MDSAPSRGRRRARPRALSGAASARARTNLDLAVGARQLRVHDVANAPALSFHCRAHASVSSDPRAASRRTMNHEPSSRSHRHDARALAGAASSRTSRTVCSCGVRRSAAPFFNAAQPTGIRHERRSRRIARQEERLHVVVGEELKRERSGRAGARPARCPPVVAVEQQLAPVSPRRSRVRRTSRAPASTYSPTPRRSARSRPSPRSIAPASMTSGKSPSVRHRARVEQAAELALERAPPPSAAPRCGARVAGALEVTGSRRHSPTRRHGAVRGARPRRSTRTGRPCSRRAPGLFSSVRPPSPAARRRRFVSSTASIPSTCSTVAPAPASARARARRAPTQPPTARPRTAFCRPYSLEPTSPARVAIAPTPMPIERKRRGRPWRASAPGTNAVEQRDVGDGRAHRPGMACRASSTRQFLACGRDEGR